jgi:hypothetical protein
MWMVHNNRCLYGLVVAIAFNGFLLAVVYNG